MATGLTDATIRVSADTRAMERDIAKSLRTVELSQINTKKSSQALGRITGQVSEFNKSLEASNARVIAFGASAGAIFAVERAIGSLITTTIEVEKKLQDVNVLLNLSSANLEKFGSSLFSIAKNTAQSFASVADAATELARQGLGVEETLRRTNAALVLARLSGLDTVKSVEALTATINSFSNSALDATQIVNKLANVDAAFAVSSADLANAISRVGSTAQDAGVSLDELISIVTAAQQTTARGGAVIGNSLKTIFTRLQRGKVQSLLESLGVDTGEGQSAVSLLQQLASVYDELSASQKSYVAEQVGGVFQINILKAALGDLGKQYSIYGRALDTSLSSTDQAIRRNEELNKTVAALSTQAVANLQQAADKIGSIVFEPNAKNFLSSINQLLESFNNIDAESQGGKFIEGFFKGISNFIGGPGTVLAVAVLTKLFVKLTQFAAGSARELLGRNEATKQQAALEQSVLSILQKNTQFTNQILSGKLSTVQAEKQLLSYLTAQSNIMKEQERLSKVIGGNLGRAGFTVSSKGIPTAPKSKSAGFVPNFASERAVGQVMEDIGAKQHGYKAGKARKTRIHDGNGKSFSSFVNNKEDVVNFKNAAGKKATIVRPPNGFGENTEFAAMGFVPNFVKNASSIRKGVILEKRINKALTGSASYSPNAPLDFPLPTGYGKDIQARRKIGISDQSIYGDAKLTRSRKSQQSLLDKYLRTPEGRSDFLSAEENTRGFINLNPRGLSMLFTKTGSDARDTAYISSLNTALSVDSKNLIDSRFGKNHKKSKTLAMPYLADKISLKNLPKLSAGFVPNFAGAKMQGLYKMRMAGATEAERATSTFRSGSSKEAELKKGRVNVQNLGSLPYTMIHPGNEGLLSSGEIDFLKKDKKTGKPTRYFAKFNTSGLSSSEIAKQANASALQDRVSNYLLGEANQFARIFNPSASFSNIGQFSDRGAVMTAVGTVFESAIRKAFNQEAASKNQDFDFPAPNQQLREFFGNAPGPYEAKGSKTLPNLQSSLEKWVRSKGLAGGFIPNFASGIVTGDVLRGNEYKAVLDYLAKTSKPIRTILGPSGSGKTTMASNLGGKIVKSFKDLDVYSDYILDRSMLSFPKDPMIAESLKKIYSKSSQANALDLIVGSRSTIKSLREKRASQGDQFIPDRSQLPTGSGGVNSFTKDVRDFTSQYPGSSVSRIFKKGGSYGTRKILNSGFIPNLAAIKGLTFSRSKKDEFGFTNLVAKIDGKKVGAFEYSEDRPGVVDVGDITVDKPFRGKGIGQALYNEAIKVNSGKMMTGQILPQTSRFLAKIKADQPASAETLYPQMKRAQSAKKATFEVWGHKGMDEEMMNLQQFKSFVDSQIKRLKSDPDAFIDFFGDIQTGNYRGLGVKLNTQHAAGFIPNFAQISQIMALESAMSGEKATFHSKPFPHVRNKSQPTFGSAMADHGGLNNALKDSVKGQKSAGLLSGGFIPNFADGVASEDSSAAFAGILAGLQGIGFTALFLGKEMREAANNIKTAKKDIKDFGTTIQKTEAQTERIEKRKARLERVAPNLTSTEIIAGKQNVGNAKQLLSDAKKTGNKADIDAANQILVEERKKLAKAEAALKNKIQQRISSIDQSIQSNRQLINEQRNEVNERRKAIAQMRSQSRSSMLSQGGMIAQILAPQVASFIPQDTQGGRGAAAGVEALGNIAGMAGTGALIGGPIGAAAGAAVAALMEIPKIEKALTSKMPQLEKAVTAATESFTKFSEGGQIFLSASEKLSTIKADPNASTQDIIGAEQQYTKALAELPIKYQEQLVAAERLGRAQETYAKILEELSVERSAKETVSQARGAFEKNQQNAFEVTGSGFKALGNAINAFVQPAVNFSASVDRMVGIQTENDNTDYMAKAAENIIDAAFGNLISKEDLSNVVKQTYTFAKGVDDPLTSANEALIAALDFSKDLDLAAFNAGSGVNLNNFDFLKTNFLDSIEKAYTASGGELTENEMQILSQLRETINRPDQLQEWIAKYQSENNQFISAQEKIAEVNKAIAERQKKEAERVAKEKVRADQRGARISAAGANMDRVFKDFSYALEEALSKIDFAGQLEKNRGQFAAEIYDAVNVPNAARNRKEQNQLFEITNTANLDREKLKSGAAKDIFTNIGDAITSASLNESVVSAMSDTEKTAAIQDFDLAKLGFKNELMGSGALDKILKGDTAGASKDINALIDKMAASGNFTATQIQDLKNKTINELNAVEAGIKTSNRNEQQQKALLAQQLAFQRASQRIQEAQSFGGGAEEIIPNLLNDPNSLINQIKDSLAMTTGGGYNVNNLTKDQFGNIIDKTTGKAPALDSLGSLTDTLSKLTKFAGVPITSMGDTNFQAISQGYSSLLLKSVDDFEQQAGGALGPEVFKRIREQLSSLGAGKEGGADVAANLQLMQKLGVIDSGQYVDEVTKGYTEKAFGDLPKELQDAYKGVTGDTKLQFLAINELTNVSENGFGDVVGAIKNSFDINKISDGIKAGLIANRVSEKKMAAEENASDLKTQAADAQSTFEKNKQELDAAKKDFKRNYEDPLSGGYSLDTFSDPQKLKGLLSTFSEENIQKANTSLLTSEDPDVLRENQAFLAESRKFSEAKAAAGKITALESKVKNSESFAVTAKGKSNAAQALLQDYKSVVTNDQSGLDKISQLYSENKDLAGKGFFTPGQNYMNPALLPKQPPIAPPTSPAQPSPIQQALTTGGAAGGAIMQPNLNTTVGSINVPVSITMPAQAAAMQSLQETQAAAFDQSVEQLRSEVQALAQKFASTQTELQNKGVVSPKPPTTPAVKPAGVAPK